MDSAKYIEQVFVPVSKVMAALGWRTKIEVDLPNKVVHLLCFRDPAVINGLQIELDVAYTVSALEIAWKDYDDGRDSMLTARILSQQLIRQVVERLLGSDLPEAPGFDYRPQSMLPEDYHA